VAIWWTWKRAITAVEMRKEKMDSIKKLQEWYQSNCDGEWEHDFGVEIGTVDNPGWIIKIDLVGTKNENFAFKEIKIERSDNDWVHAWVENNVFNAACGALNFNEGLEIFLKWAKKKRDLNTGLRDV
jgi:hypothetical protein